MLNGLSHVSMASAGKAMGGRELLKRTVLFLIFVVVVLLAYSGYGSYRGRVRLQAVIAEADRLDPGWRLHEHEANRFTPPDEENGAQVVLRASQLLPPGLSISSLPGKPLQPNLALGEEQVRRIRGFMEAAEPAVAECRKLVDYRRGRFPPSYMPDGAFVVGYVQEALAFSDILAHDAMLRMHEGDVDGAVTSCLALISLNNVIGDEWAIYASIIRMRIRHNAIDMIERLLAQRQLTEAQLLRLQSRLDEEKDASLLLTIARSFRWYSHSGIESLKTGKTGWREAAAMLPQRIGKTGVGFVDEIVSWLSSLHRGQQVLGITDGMHASILEFHNQVVEIAKMPVEEHYIRLKALYADKASQLPYHPMAPINLDANGQKKPRLLLFAERDQATLMRIRCALVALAAERFRLANGRWPDSLDELVPRFLDRIPLDSFNRQPIRMRRLDDGIVIYSVGSNLIDDGGKGIPPRRPFFWPPADSGFRLWDVEDRRRPREEK